MTISIPANKDEPPVLIAAAIFIFGYVFVWYIWKGADFFLTYNWYLETLAWLVGGLVLVSALGNRVAQRWPSLIEAPNTEAPFIFSIVAGAGAFALAIAGGIIDGPATGVLVFWPAAAVLTLLAHMVHWSTHQVGRWWRLWTQ